MGDRGKTEDEQESTAIVHAATAGRVMWGRSYTEYTQVLLW